MRNFGSSNKRMILRLLSIFHWQYYDHKPEMGKCIGSTELRYLTPDIDYERTVRIYASHYLLVMIYLCTTFARGPVAPNLSTNP